MVSRISPWEYYQTLLEEKYLLLTPFVIHPSCRIRHRTAASRTFPQAASAQIYNSVEPQCLHRPQYLRSHPFHHRLAPTDASAPIFAVIPAKLDYEFVKTGLHRFPWRSWALYTRLVVSVLVHTVEGVNVLRITWLGAARPSSQTRKLIACAAALPVMFGLWAVSREPLMVLSSTVERYSAWFAMLWVYRA